MYGRFTSKELTNNMFYDEINNIPYNDDIDIIYILYYVRCSAISCEMNVQK